jgi:hypothetical protein
VKFLVRRLTQEHQVYWKHVIYDVTLCTLFILSFFIFHNDWFRYNGTRTRISRSILFKTHCNRCVCVWVCVHGHVYMNEFLTAPEMMTERGYNSVEWKHWGS